MLTDPIGDYLTRVRNALQAEHEDVVIPSSRLKREMSRILKEQGYISDFAHRGGEKGEVIRVQLRYTEDRSPVITGMRTGLPPGPPPLRPQRGRAASPGGMGTAIVSTSTGVMTGHEARKKGVGGEIVAYVW